MDEFEKKANSLENFLIAIIRGEFEGDKVLEFDELLKEVIQKCRDNGIEINTDLSKSAKIVFDECVKKINEENGLDLDITLDSFEDSLCQYMKAEMSAEKKRYVLDSITNLDIMHNSTNSVCENIRSYLAFHNSELVQELSAVCRYLYPIESNSVFDDIFGPATGDDEELKSSVKKSVEQILLHRELANILLIRKRHSMELGTMLHDLSFAVYREKYPEFVEQLEQFKNSAECTYYFHGSPSAKISEKICEEGLFMQYGDIDRTAKTGLDAAQLIDYSYGHDGVGRHSIVVIAVPKGEYPVNVNNDESIRIAGTGQGQQVVNDFNPSFVIPRKYIYGIIDKDNYVVIPNEHYMDKDLESGIKNNF